MTPETALGPPVHWRLSRYNASTLERLLKDVETTIRPLVETVHKMTDMKLTVHDISESIMTQVTSNLSSSFVPFTFVTLFRFGIESDLKWIAKQRNNNHYASSYLRYILTALKSGGFLIIDLDEGFRESYKIDIWDGALPFEHSKDAITDVAVAAVLHLLACVFQYLIGHTDRGCSKTYSSGCLDFRDSFVSLLLFHGAYVWIKFRQPATGKRKATGTQSGDDRSKVYARASRNGSATRYEARYNIPTDRLDEDHTVRCPRLSLGLYKSDVEASFVSRVARSFYEVHQPGEACCVEIQPGVHHKFSVPAMSEQERELEGEEKRQWVISKAKQVGKLKYAEFRKEKLAMATDTESSDPSPSPMCAHSADEPLNAYDAPSWPNPARSPCEKSIRAKLSIEGPVISEGVESQWSGESLPFSNFTCGSSDEDFADFEAMWAELGFDSGPQQKTTLDMSSPCSDFAQILENDSLPHFEEAVEHPEAWYVQNFQQLRDAGDAAMSYADGTGSEPFGVEQSKLVLYQQSQVFTGQSYEAVQPQVSELQILETSLETSQQICDRVEVKEPTESIIQPYECLLKDNKCLREEIERLQKEKERSDREKERLKSIIRQLLH